MGGKEKWKMGEGVQEEKKWGWYLPTLTACDSVSSLLHLAWLPMCGKVYHYVHMYHSNSQLTR